MQIGICGSLDQIPALAMAGADYLEMNIRSITRPDLADDQWSPPSANAWTLPLRNGNSFIAPDVRLTGPDVDIVRQNEAVGRVLRRAGAIAAGVIVFGSGGARNIPDGFFARHRLAAADRFWQASRFAGGGRRYYASWSSL